MEQPEIPAVVAEQEELDEKHSKWCTTLFTTMMASFGQSDLSSWNKVRQQACQGCCTLSKAVLLSVFSTLYWQAKPILERHKKPDLSSWLLLFALSSVTELSPSPWQFLFMFILCWTSLSLCRKTMPIVLATLSAQFPGTSNCSDAQQQKGTAAATPVLETYQLAVSAALIFLLLWWLTGQSLSLGCIQLLADMLCLLLGKQPFLFPFLLWQGQWIGSHILLYRGQSPFWKAVKQVAHDSLLFVPDTVAPGKHRLSQPPDSTVVESNSSTMVDPAVRHRRQHNQQP